MLSLILFPALLPAQEDTVKSVISEMPQDSLLQLPPQEESVVDEGYRETPVSSGSVYFLNKSRQSNGGGPDSFQVRKLPDTLTGKLKRDKDFWYANYDFEKKGKKKKKQTSTVVNESGSSRGSKSLMDEPFFEVLLWVVIIGGFAAFVILYLSNSNVNLFRKKGMMHGSGEEQYAETDNIFEIDYQRQIDKAISNGNYRFAIRLMFLRVLKNLSEKKVIDYKQDRTNFDYLTQIHSTKYYKDFSRITLDYEYSWYGQFDIDKEKFGIIKNDFEKFDHNLK